LPFGGKVELKPIRLKLNCEKLKIS
jgi:hypothetical protein